MKGTMRVLSFVFLLVVAAACGTVTVPLNVPGGAGPNAIAGAATDAAQETAKAARSTDWAVQSTRAAENASAQQASMAGAMTATAESQRSTAAADGALALAMQANAEAMQANAQLTRAAAYAQMTQMADMLTATAAEGTRAAAIGMQSTALAIEDANKDAARNAALKTTLSIGVGILFFAVAAIITVAVGYLMIGTAQALANRQQARAEQEWGKAEQEKAKAEQEKAKARRDEVLEYDSILINLVNHRVIYQPRILPATATVIEHSAPSAQKAPELHQPRGLDETVGDAETGETRAEVLRDRLVSWCEFAAGTLADEGRAAGKGEGKDKDGKDVWAATIIPSAGRMLKVVGYGNESWQLRKNFFARYGWLEASTAGTAITGGRTLRDMVQWVNGLDDEFLESYLAEKEAAQKIAIVGVPISVPSPTAG